MTLPSDHDFHSRRAAPCIKTCKPATPISRELPTSYRPYATLFNQVVSAIAQVQRNPALLTDSRFDCLVPTIRASAHSLFATFTPLGSCRAWLPQLRDTLTEYRLHEQQQVQQERRDVWQSWVRETWALNSKKIYQLVKGKSVEPFTCLQHQGRIVTDRSQIDRLLQEAWNPIFAIYPEGEDKAPDCHTTFSLVPGTYPSCSFPRLTLEDFHFVLRRKLKANTATGLDGWRPHELKSLPDCLLSALLDIYHLCEQVGHFPSSSYYSYTTLIPTKVWLVPHLVCGLSPFFLYLIDFMPVFVVRHYLNGRTHGFIPRNSPFVRGAVLLVFTVICRLISLSGIDRMVALLAFSLTLLHVLILYLILSFGLLSNTMVAILPLLLCCLICTITYRAVFGMQDASAPSGMLRMVYCKVTHLVLLFFIASSAL